MFAMIILVACIPTTANAVEWNVTPSKVNYFVEMNDASNIFLCNKKSIGTKVGTEYYMTYTVDSVDEEALELANQGVMGTNVPANPYPYLTTEDGKGGYYMLDNANKLLVEGRTYFIKFTITEDGYQYRAAWAQNNKSRYLEFNLSTAGEVKTELGYFGVWFGCNHITGSLTKVRFYDKAGNDLGAQVTVNKNAEVGREDPFPKDTKVEHTYDIILKDRTNVAISNKRVPTSDTVYMEYKVESVENTHAYQTGVILSSAPTAGYPYLNGLMYFNRGMDVTIEKDVTKVDGGPLLQQGAEYLIIFERKTDALEVTAQKTLNGKATYITFEITFGSYSKDADYFSLWFGEGPDFKVNATLTDFKCYDSNKNNLGVQCNQTCEIIHHGQLEDYAGCEAMYVCKEDYSLYALYEDQSLKYTENDETQSGTYRVEDSVLTTQLVDEKRNYDFKYRFFIGEDERTYRRLHSYKLTFDTGDGSKVESQVLNADNGYMPMRPSEPTLEGNTFEGWYTSDGEEYKFDRIATESMTLYAKWKNVNYKQVNTNRLFYAMPYIAIAVGTVLLVASAVAGVIIIKGKKNG